MVNNYKAARKLNTKKEYVGSIERLIKLFIPFGRIPIFYITENRAEEVTKISFTSEGKDNVIEFHTNTGATIYTTIGKNKASKATTMDNMIIEVSDCCGKKTAKIIDINTDVANNNLDYMEFILRHYKVLYNLPNTDTYIKIDRVVRLNNKMVSVTYEEKINKKIISGGFDIMERDGKIINCMIYFDMNLNRYILAHKLRSN